jgi:hypothetical protein
LTPDFQDRFQAFDVTILRILHVGGGWLAFVAAPIALSALKGARRHVLAGRWFLVALTLGIAAGLVLAVIDDATGLLFFGLLMLFLLGSGYLAPRIGRGSRRWYRWDRALTAVGVLGSLGLIAASLNARVLPWDDLALGGVGLGIALAHARWRGPRDPTRWQLEHLTSLLAAYTVVWSFILALYVSWLPQAIRLVVPVLGVVAIFWARRRFGRATAAGDPAAALA